MTTRKRSTFEPSLKLEVLRLINEHLHPDRRRMAVRPSAYGSPGTGLSPSANEQIMAPMFG